MKKITLQLAIMLFAFSLSAQWIPVNNGLPDYPPTTIISWVDTIVLSTYGGGIYLTYDSGENWTEMPGTLPNLLVNDIRYNGGQFDPISVATDGGPFIAVNGAYVDCNGSGLTNPQINFFCGGYQVLTGDAIVGTNGEGIFAAEYTSPFIYDWATSNAGLTGDALIVNDAFTGEGLAIIATDGGMYKAMGDETEWTAKNNGLSGDALKVNKICYLGTVILIATHGGLYYTLDMDDSWLPVISDEKLNVVFYINTDISPAGFMVFALGENGYYTEDFETWSQMDFGGMEGEVTAAHADAANLYIGFTIDGKDAKENGGIYRAPLEQFVVGIEEEYPSELSNYSLEQNHPNPFAQSTNILYSLKKSGFISLKVYDFTGREINTLVNKFHEKGDYSVVFNAENLPNGIYSYKLQIGNNLVETKKMVLVK